MKCEICHQTDAETAILRGEGDTTEELYVCRACAKAERLWRQKKSHRTRKMTGLPPGVSMSITRFGPEGDDEESQPPLLKAFIDAMDGMVSSLEKAAKSKSQSDAGKKAKAVKKREFPSKGIRPFCVLRGRFHLEGLHLIGELEAVKRAVRALGMDLLGVDADGLRETGHIYSLCYAGSDDQAVRVADDLMREERNARVRLFEEMPHVFGDSLCRALAILKNCRLLAPSEFFDLLSPLRLAALEDLLDGITYQELERLLSEIDLTSSEDELEPSERDRVDSERADEMNRFFEDVVLNERAEEKLQ